VGTTGVLKPNEVDGWVNESTPWSTEMARVAGEKYLWGHGATLVLSAGIYGPGRDPRGWIAKGLVGPTSKFVNFVHVEDLCQIVLAAGRLGSQAQGHVFLAADGKPQMWKDIFAHLNLPNQENGQKNLGGRTRESKRVDSRKTLATLGIKLKYPDIFSYLDKSPFPA